MEENTNVAFISSTGIAEMLEASLSKMVSSHATYSLVL
jgi:hypothetical protein